MSDQIERHADKLLREWEQIQQMDYWKLVAAAWEKLQTEAINFTLSTHGYETILRSRGVVDGIRQATKMPDRIAEDIKAGKKG